MAEVLAQAAWYTPSFWQQGLILLLSGCWNASRQLATVLKGGGSVGVGGGEPPGAWPEAAKPSFPRLSWT